MQKIKPNLYILDTDPVPEAVIDASKWFETENITVIVDSSNGELTRNSYVEWYMAQGWVIYNTSSESKYVGGIPYEVKTFFLRRRKLQSERVLNDMIREFTDAYNEGREINDRRYDEIVNIYNVIVDKSEEDLHDLDLAAKSYYEIITSIISSVQSDFNEFKGDVGTISSNYGNSRRVDVNARFDSELSKARQGLVERGMNNTTSWASVSAGIERERERALSDLEDKITDRRVGIAGTINSAREAMRTKMMAAHERLMASRREDAITPLDFRNKILSAMLNFMERRTDDYPGLDGLANIAAQLGYSEGAAVVAPTA